MPINSINSVAPPFLIKGDFIEIVAPARYVSKKEIHFAIQLIKKAGFNVKINSRLFDKKNIFSGDIVSRTNNLQNALDSVDTKAILFARGGYGTIQIIDYLNFEKFKNSPKWLIGFSDITTILTHVYTVYNIQSIHGPMPFNFAQTNKNHVINLFDILKGKINNLKCIRNKFDILGSGSGRLFGGNLSILCSLIGSRSFILNKQKIILFIEDLDEYLYHIERMLYTLDRSGLFKRVEGLIIGKMKNILDNEIGFGKSTNRLILDIVDKYHFPVCFDFPIGHDINNSPLVIGSNVTLEINKYDTNLFFQDGR